MIKTDTAIHVPIAKIHTAAVSGSNMKNPSNNNNDQMLVMIMSQRLRKVPKSANGESVKKPRSCKIVEITLE